MSANLEAAWKVPLSVDECYCRYPGDAVCPTHAAIAQVLDEAEERGRKEREEELLRWIEDPSQGGGP